MSDFTFLTEEQVDQLDILKKYGKKAAMTDFSILLGGTGWNYINEGNSLKNCVSWWWTKTLYGDDADYEDDSYDCVRVVIHNGCIDWYGVDLRVIGARPALPYSSILGICSNALRGKNGILEVEYGEYPQDIVSEDEAKTLEREYLNRTINQTGKSYTTDSVSDFYYNTPFKARNHTEYEYNGRKYIRIIGEWYCRGSVLSDGRTVEVDVPYWVEVKPIKWMIDEKANIALSKRLIFSGVQFNCGRLYGNDFNETDIKKFMDKYFSKDIIPSFPRNMILEDSCQIDSNQASIAIAKKKIKKMMI